MPVCRTKGHEARPVVYSRSSTHLCAACAENINPTPDPELSLAGLQAKAGLTPRGPLHPSTPRAEGLLEWRRRCWQAVKEMGVEGREFTVEDVLARVGQAPDQRGHLHVEGLLLTAAHTHRLLVHLPTGPWLSAKAYDERQRAVKA